MRRKQPITMFLCVFAVCMKSVNNFTKKYKSCEVWEDERRTERNVLSIQIRFLIVAYRLSSIGSINIDENKCLPIPIRSRMREKKEAFHQASKQAARRRSMNR